MTNEEIRNAALEYTRGKHNASTKLSKWAASIILQNKQVSINRTAKVSDSMGEYLTVITESVFEPCTLENK